MATRWVFYSIVQNNRQQFVSMGLDLASYDR